MLRCESVGVVCFQDLVTFEKQWSCFFSSMDLESHLSILELSEAQAGEVFVLLSVHRSSTMSGQFAFQ